jgi:hypothetical protein
VGVLARARRLHVVEAGDVLVGADDAFPVEEPEREHQIVTWRPHGDGHAQFDPAICRAMDEPDLERLLHGHEVTSSCHRAVAHDVDLEGRDPGGRIRDRSD